MDEKKPIDPADRELFLAEWDLVEGELTDQQIEIAIRTGQL